MVFLLGTFPGQSQPIHNTLNPLMIHREATPCKFLAYSSYAISSFVFLEDTLNFRGYICISLLNFIWFSNLIIIGRLRQLHHCQQIFQGISFFTEFFDERCFFALSCAAHFSSLKAMQNITSDRGIMLRMNRSIQVEGAFGLLKNDFSFRRFMTTGKRNIRIELFFLALGFNLKKRWMKQQKSRLETHYSEKKAS